MIVAVLRRSLACTGHVELNRSEKCEYIIDNPEDSKEQTGTDSKTPIKEAKTCWRNIFVLENRNSGETPIYKRVFLNFRHKTKKRVNFATSLNSTLFENYSVIIIVFLVKKYVWNWFFDEILGLSKIPLLTFPSIWAGNISRITVVMYKPSSIFFWKLAESKPPFRRQKLAEWYFSLLYGIG